MRRVNVFFPTTESGEVTTESDATSDDASDDPLKEVLTTVEAVYASLTDDLIDTKRSGKEEQEELEEIELDITLSGLTKQQQKAAMKRARRSAIEKKSRQRRQNILRRMREDVKRLEEIYNELLQTKHTKTINTNLLLPSSSISSGRNSSPQSMADLQKLFTHLSVLVLALDDERRSIRKLLVEHEQFLQAIRQIATETESEETTMDVFVTPGIPMSESFSAGFLRLSTTECYAIVRESYETICRRDRSGRFVSSNTHFMGWNDRRFIDETTNALNYGFQKRFLNQSAEVLLLKTWDMFRDPIKMMRISFDTSVEMKFQVLQTMNDDIYIIRRDHRHPGIEQLTFLTVHILFRLQTPKGYTLCFRTIPASEIKDALQPHEIWFDVFHWSHFHHVRDADGQIIGVDVVTGGSIADPSMKVAHYWMFELMVSVLRWENACVSPLFLAQF